MFPQHALVIDFFQKPMCKLISIFKNYYLTILNYLREKKIIQLLVRSPNGHDDQSRARQRIQSKTPT